MTAEWLYSRLMMLKEQTMDDLTFHSICFEGKQYTIEEAINQILNASYEYLYTFEVVDTGAMPLEYDDIGWDEHCDTVTHEFKAAIRLWAEIMKYADRVVCYNRKHS